MPVYNAYGPDS
ncbi:hypothetical protein PENSOL_c134G03547 [Penicillium solitum]|uniref:Uncharacterized protein n=1 Tax=Penicillium solitum TaxID=60172 RepID=A0A1V6Q3S8_9EURO|nr:hypothetical protein PENSOL_c134G03547 [Penicillium solitum]